MKILMYSWEVYHERDIVSAFENLGHEVSLFTIKFHNQNEDEESVKYVYNILQENNYDMIFSVNYFGVISDACEISKVKYVVWTCDSPLISMHHQSVFNSYNYLFVFDKVSYHSFKALGVSHIYYLPLAVNCKRLNEVIEKKSEADENLEMFKSEISFVGSLYYKNAYDEIENKLSDYLKGYFEAAMRAQIDIHGRNIMDNVLTPEILYQLNDLIEFRQEERSFSDISLVFSTTFLGFKAASMERIKSLNELAKKHQVKLYTDRESKDLQFVDNCGPVNYLQDMPKVFRNSNINLNFTIRNIRSGIPLRVWDVLGSEGFLLTNFQAELPDFFENGKDLVYFNGIYDLCQKADYYLEHEEERLEIARNGYSKVEKYHSYEQRLKKIVELLEL